MLCRWSLICKMGKIILGYWDIRGRGAAARMMLDYGGLEWEDKKYAKLEQWFGKDKQEIELDFPNLPYLIDSDVRLTECWAIFRYIGRKIGLAPATKQAEAESDMLQGVISDFSLKLVETCYNPGPNFEEDKAKLRTKQLSKLGQFERFLKSRVFLTGPKLCFVDFIFFQILDHHRLLFPDILDDFPNVKAYLKRFESDEKIAKHLNSDNYYTFPLFAPWARWGGQSK